MLGERAGIALFAQPHEVVFEGTIEERDPLVTELDLPQGRQVERLLVVGIDPRVGLGRFSASVRHKGNVRLAHQLDPGSATLVRTSSSADTQRPLMKLRYRAASRSRS